MFAFGALTLGAAARARADTCPEIPETETAMRRSMAKEWFAKAEESEASGDKPAAVRRYACSLNLTPHPSTAYNLGTVAEKSGDWSMAIEGFRAYLKLSPEAPDRPTIEARLATLEAKLAALRKDLAAKDPNAEVPATPAPVAPIPAPPIVPSPATDDGAHGRHVAGWILLAAAGASAGTGLALNLVARSRVDDCYREWNMTGMTTALDRCDQARPYAYGSYALFGAGGALAATGVLMLLWPHGHQAAEAPASPSPLSFQPSFVPLRGGGGAFVAGRF
ncbi:MAG TPA: tetratricopeptide repeat protein [Polyangia bacterium]|nr:tetratricopeptide repeat protein [Polyangia bacterium]